MLFLQLYSNTPTDFDFKLKRLSFFLLSHYSYFPTLVWKMRGQLRYTFTFCKLIFKTHFVCFFISLAQRFYSLAEFAEHLASATDIVFPAIHGKFGEDGGLQVWLKWIMNNGKYSFGIYICIRILLIIFIKRKKNHSLGFFVCLIVCILGTVGKGIRSICWYTFKRK